jgi:3-deoxy-D-arabino-heptulosonate 7-phosphate (DAHP) synthase
LEETKTLAQEVEIGNFKVGAGHRPFLIAGPCVIESEQLVLETAARTGLVLLIRRTVRPGGYASGFTRPAAPGWVGGIR